MLAFNITHVRILGTNNCGEMQQTDFKQSESFQDVLCCHDFYERAFEIFSHQIQSGYYNGDRSVSI